MRLAPETFRPDAIWWIGAIAAAVALVFFVLNAFARRPRPPPDDDES